MTATLIAIVGLIMLAYFAWTMSKIRTYTPEELDMIYKFEFEMLCKKDKEES
jgi:hypothetical protein